MSTHTDDLPPLPCPFCGHVGLDFKEGSTFRWLAYSCGGCGMGNETRVQTLGEGTQEGWLARAELDAIAEWNTRAALAQPAVPQRPPTPVGCSDTDWLRHLESCPPIGYAVRDNLYGTSKAGVLRFCAIGTPESFAVYASPRPTQTEPTQATPAQVPLTEFQRMQIIGNSFPIALVQPIILAKVDAVCCAIERAVRGT